MSDFINTQIKIEVFDEMVRNGEIQSENIGFHIFEKTSKGQYMLLHLSTFEILKSKGYNISIVLKITNDGYFASSINHRVKVYLSSNKSNYELLDKMKIKLCDIRKYYGQKQKQKQKQKLNCPL